MIGKQQWLALVRGNRWTLAKVSGRRKNLKIHQIFEFEGESAFQREEFDELDDAEIMPPVHNNPEQDWLDSTANLKKWLRKQRVPLKKVKYTLSCPGVITRMITLPKLTNKDLEKLLTEQVDQYFTLNISDYIVEYRILEKVQEEGQERLRVLLVAIPLNEWEKQWKRWDSIGVTPKLVDFSADCICRLYRYLSGWGEDKNQVPVADMAIVDLGKDRVELVLIEHGVFFLYSDMDISLGDFLEQGETGVLTEPAEKDELSELLETNELGNPNEPIKLFEEIEPIELVDHDETNVPDELEVRLLPVFNTLSEFLNFFASRHYGKSVDQIFITGECADYANLEALFEKNMGIQSRVGFPEDWRPKFTRKSRDFAEQWMKYGSLYGLAIRED